MKSKYTESFIPVQNITNGMIILDDNSKVTGIKIQPRNIFILDYGTQSSIIDNLKVVYNTIDYEFWIVVADRPVDINVYLSQLQLLFNSVNNPRKRKIVSEDINKAQMFISNNIVDTEYYLLFKEKKDDVIQRRIRDLISKFANAGLTSQPVSNEDLRIVLDNFLNGGQSSSFGTVLSE